MAVQTETAAGPIAESAPAAQKKKKRKKGKKKWVILILLLAVAGAGVFFFLRMRSNANASEAAVYTTVNPETREIVQSLSDSGTLEPADSYNVTTLVSGDILTADFEEGDVVKKGDTLYEIDNSDGQTSIESAQNNVSNAEISYENAQVSYQKQQDSLADQEDDLKKLTITAPFSGTITDVSVNAGDTVSSGTVVATLTDSDNMTLTQYVSTAYQSQFYVGMPAQVTVSSLNLTLTGTVTEMYNDDYRTDTGMECFTVVVSVENSGVLSESVDGICTFGTTASPIYPVGEAAFEYADAKTITCETSGTVENVYIHDNSRVSEGDTLVLLSGDDLDDSSVQSAYLSLQSSLNSLNKAKEDLENAEDSLDDYIVTAPIDGTIVDKVYKQGEKSKASETLCTIYDLSYLTVTLSVDELDISNVAVGQTASITADAVDGKTYTGTVIRVGVNGTASSGVTTYPVDIRIDDTDGLLPGMNVDAVIIINDVTDALAIPAAAVARGNQVLVVDSTATGEDGAPEGYKYVTIETGISDDTYVEVTSGLTADDVIAYIPETADTSDDQAMMGMNMGMNGDMSGGGGGGMPDGGGGGGGAPGGGGPGG